MELISSKSTISGSIGLSDVTAQFIKEEMRLSHQNGEDLFSVINSVLGKCSTNEECFYVAWVAHELYSKTQANFEKLVSDFTNIQLRCADMSKESEYLEEINHIMWTTWGLKDCEFGRSEGKRIMDVLNKWAK